MRSPGRILAVMALCAMAALVLSSIGRSFDADDPRTSASEAPTSPVVSIAAPTASIASTPPQSPVVSPTPTLRPAATPTSDEADAPIDEPAIEPTAQPTATEEALPGRSAAGRNRACLAELPTRVALGQLLIPLTTPGELAAAATAGSRGAIGGVVLLGAPSAAQIAEFAAGDEAGLDLLVTSDEEGGSVQRLGHLLGPLPSARAMAGMETRALRRLVRSYARGLAELGVDVTFAPVVDVGGGPGIGDRAFGTRPGVVTRRARTVAEAFRSGGVIPTLKHFPGHGRASADSHVGFAVTPPLAELRRVDLRPYVSLLESADLVMVGHLLVPGLTEDLPTSLSPAAIDGLLRDELGYDGVVITDALNMAAIAERWSNEDAALLALRAGADLLIIDRPSRARDVIDHLRSAVDNGRLRRGRIDRSLARVLELRGIDPCEAARRFGNHSSN